MGRDFKKLLILVAAAAIGLSARIVFGANQASRTISSTTIEGSYAPENLLKDAGFERGTRAWSVSGGSLAITNTSSQVARGSSAGSFDSNSASQTLTSAATTIPAGLFGKNGVVSCALKCDSGTCTHKIQAYDGTDVLAESTITSSTSIYARSSTSFIFPTSGSIRARIISVASNEPPLYVDDCFVGGADGTVLSPVSQAQMYGTLRYAGTASCIWQTSSGSYTNYSADTDCPTPSTGGYASAPGTKIPGITFPTLPAGDYLVSYNATVTTGASTGCNFRISDGTSDGGFTQVTNSGGFINSNIAKFSYTTDQTNVTFQIQGLRFTGASTCDIYNADTTTAVEFVVTRFPSSSEIASRPDLIPGSYSAYHGNDCVFSRTGSSFGDPSADSSCTFTETTNKNFGSVTSALSAGDKLPGLNITARKAGRYLAISTFTLYGATSGAQISAALTDGTTTYDTRSFRAAQANDSSEIVLMGIVNLSLSPTDLKIQIAASSGATTIDDESGISVQVVNWTLVPLDQALQAPILVGGVVQPSSGIESLTRFNGTCSSSSSVSSNLSGTTISNISSGACTITLPANYTSAPVCTATLKGSTLGTLQAISVNPTSSTTVDIYARDTIALTSYDFQVQCMGAR